MLDRGGTGYVATIKNINTPESVSDVSDILASSETKQFDVGQIPEMGDEFTWSPQVLKPESFDVLVDGAREESLDNFDLPHPKRRYLTL